MLINTILCCFLITLVKGQVQLNSSHGGGIMIYNLQSVYSYDGLFHIDIKTNKVHYTDSEKILTNFFQFAKECKNSETQTKANCRNFVEILRENTLEAIRLIGKRNGRHFNTTFLRNSYKREKREKGFFWRFLSWAFSLSDNTDSRTDYSSGLLSHTIDAITKMGNTLNHHETLLQEEYEKLKRELDYRKPIS
jgi:hypothetical protein